MLCNSSDIECEPPPTAIAHTGKMWEDWLRVYLHEVRQYLREVRSTVFMEELLCRRNDELSSQRSSAILMNWRIHVRRSIGSTVDHCDRHFADGRAFGSGLLDGRSQVSEIEKRVIAEGS